MIPQNHLKPTNVKKQKKQLGVFFNEIEPQVLKKMYKDSTQFGYKQYLRIVKSRLSHHKIKLILDVGCGEGTPMVEYLKMGYKVRGIDYSDEVIKLAKNKLYFHQYDPNLVSKCDITKAKDYPKEKFDCIICIGVFPHIHDQDFVMKQFNRHLNDGGTVFIQFRNPLFSLFSLNQYSYELFRNELIPFEKLGVLKKDVDEFLKKKLSTKTMNEEVSVFCQFNNPLVIHELFKKHHLEIKKIHFAHYHIAPPIFEVKNPKLYNNLSYAWKDHEDWRGYFMCSSYIVEAIKT